ncbi:MAG: RICIN domain-containing protein [Luteolibacter sp.]|jgi:hypothetical protein|nr:RICIN domain-containing protein [Luteolibacter sp.]
MKIIKNTKTALRAQAFAPEFSPHPTVKKNTWRTSLCAGLACCLAPATLTAAPLNYTFDNFGPNALVGNGWYSDSTYFNTLHTATNGGQPNNTRYALREGVGGSQGCAIRNFGSPFFPGGTGRETKALFQLDYRVGGSTASVELALGGKPTPTQTITSGNPSSFGPKIKISTNAAGTGVVFSIIPKSGAGWGTSVDQTVAISPATIRVGDWIQVAFVMNLTGSGSGTMSYRNLSLGSVQNTANVLYAPNLGLSAASSSPDLWNQVWIWSLKPTVGLAAGVDNLIATANGPGSENFEGERTSRTLNVYHYTGITNGVRLPMLFPDFVPLLANQSAQINQFNNAHIPDFNTTADFAQIVPDPTGGTNKCVRLHNFATPGTSKGRNEIHYSTPYVTENQPNGTQYTFALRFHTPDWFSGEVILLQGYSEFPWLRILANSNGRISLDLAKSSGSVVQYNAWETWKNANPGAPVPRAYNPVTGQYEDLYGPTTQAQQTAWNSWLASPVGTPPTIIGPDLALIWNPDEHPALGYYKKGGWNTLVVQVTHSNDPATGRIEVFVNGNKMTSYQGRTTYLTDSTRIPWLKAGPYGTENTVWYDDVHWVDGHVYPSYPNEPGLEHGGIYSVQSVVAPGKSLNVVNAHTADGTNVQIWDTGTAPNSRFTAELKSDGSFELIPNNAPGQRLDVHNAGGSGSNLQIWRVNTHSNQRWKAEWKQSDGNFKLNPQHTTGLSLDVVGGANANGTNVQVYTANDTPAQRWRLVRVN